MYPNVPIIGGNDPNITSQYQMVKKIAEDLGFNFDQICEHHNKINQKPGFIGKQGGMEVKQVIAITDTHRGKELGEGALLYLKNSNIQFEDDGSLPDNSLAANTLQQMGYAAEDFTKINENTILYKPVADIIEFDEIDPFIFVDPFASKGNGTLDGRYKLSRSLKALGFSFDLFYVRSPSVLAYMPPKETISDIPADVLRLNVIFKKNSSVDGRCQLGRALSSLGYDYNHFFQGPHNTLIYKPPTPGAVERVFQLAG